MQKNKYIITLIILIFSMGCMGSIDEAVPLSPYDYVKAVSINGRVFYYIEPVTGPAAGGYPVMICFHGGDGFARSWLSSFDITYGGFGFLAYQRGYFVIAAESGLMDDPSGSYNDVKKRWDVSLNSHDIPYILDIIDWLAASGYHVNMNRIFGTGISSGGSMISRMCQSVPGIFKRVAIVATINPNYGYTSSVQVINDDHPSTLFIHGTADTLAPYARMLEYYTGLQDSHAIATGFNDSRVKIIYRVDIAGGGHTWFRDYNDDIITWCENAP